MVRGGLTEERRVELGVGWWIMPAIGMMGVGCETVEEDVCVDVGFIGSYWGLEVDVDLW